MGSKATNFGLSLAAAIATLLANAAWAETISIVNESFENPTIAIDGDWTVNSIPGWTVVNSSAGIAGVWNPALFTIRADNPGVDQDFLGGFTGPNVAFSNGSNIRQDLDEEVGVGYLYTLKVKVGGRVGYSNKLFGVLLRRDGPYDLPKDLTLAGTWNRNVASQWFEQTTTFEAIDPGIATQKLAVVLTNEQSGAAGVQVDFDDVSLMRQKLVVCEGFFAPFDKALALKSKENRAIPVKMRLYDYLGNELTDADFAVPPVVNVMMLPAGAVEGAAQSSDLVSAGLAEDGNAFRYDPNAGQWIINLAAKMYKTAGTYEVSVQMGDPEFAVQSTATCSGTFVRQ